jgi:hypothetical protein
MFEARHSNDLLSRGLLFASSDSGLLQDLYIMVAAAV